MGNSIDQQVIDFVAGYFGQPSSSINASTTFSSLGCSTLTDIINCITATEDHFGFDYVPGDEDGINTVGDLIALIKRKQGGGSV